jgi:hypothetical protein
LTLNADEKCRTHKSRHGYFSEMGFQRAQDSSSAALGNDMKVKLRMTSDKYGKRQVQLH